MKTISTLALLLTSALTPCTVADEKKPAEKKQPRGYSIPLIDLSGEKHRQVVVDREKGVYLGHPTTVLLEDQKTMICVYPAGHGRGRIIMKRSSDAGLTWSARLKTPENWATSKEVPTIHRAVSYTHLTLPTKA